MNDALSAPNVEDASTDGYHLLGNLPPELILHIFSYLHPSSPTVCYIAQSCSLYHNLISDSVEWMVHIDQEFSHLQHSRLVIQMFEQRNNDEKEDNEENCFNEMARIAASHDGAQRRRRQHQQHQQRNIDNWRMYHAFLKRLNAKFCGVSMSNSRRLLRIALNSMDYGLLHFLLATPCLLDIVEMNRIVEGYSDDFPSISVCFDEDGGGASASTLSVPEIAEYLYILQPPPSLSKHNVPRAHRPSRAINLLPALKNGNIRRIRIEGLSTSDLTTTLSSIIVTPEGSTHLFKNTTVVELEIFDIDLIDIEPFSFFVERLASLQALHLRGVSQTLHRVEERIAMQSAIFGCNHLKSLKLNGCAFMTSLIAEIGNLSQNLEVLDLSEGPTVSLCVEIGQLGRRLRHLSLDYCGNLSSIPEELGDCQMLEYLSVKESSITSFPSSIGNMKRLESLNASRCVKLRSIPSSVGNLANLLEIDLSYSSIDSLPFAIGDLKALRSLNLDRCEKLTSLPPTIGKLDSLQKLSLRHCRMRRIPHEVAKLPKLRELDLYATKNIQNIPSSISAIPSLRKLNLSYSEIVSLPDSLGTMHGLLELILDECKYLEVLPPSIGGLRSITQLNLSSSLVQFIPDSITTLENLLEIDLSFCYSIEALPLELGKIRKLKRLTLYYCVKLRELPLSIGELEELSILNLSRSGIVELPSTICDLKRLTILKIDNCKNLDFDDCKEEVSLFLKKFC